MTSESTSPVELDGPIADPEHHRVLFENDQVRVVQTTILAGDTTPVHTHLTPHLIAFSSGSQFVRRDPEGAILVDTRTHGADYVIPPYAWVEGVGPHTIENVGPDDIFATSVERKP